MNQRGRDFIKKLDVSTNSLLNFVYMSKSERGDLFQRLVKERYELYRTTINEKCGDNFYGYDEFYNAVRMRITYHFKKWRICPKRSTNCYMTQEELRDSIRILNQMFPVYSHVYNEEDE